MAVNQKRVDEVTTVLFAKSNNTVYPQSYSDYLATLPEFQTPEWIRCADRMPEINQSIYWHDAQCERGPVSDIYTNEFLDPEDYWMPRFIPAPPVEEDSELVKWLKELEFSEPLSCCRQTIIKKAVEIVKEFEKAGKK